MMKKIKWFTFDEVLSVYPLLKPSPNGSNTADWFLSMLSAASLTLQYVGIASDGSVIKQADVKKYIDGVMDVLFDRQHDNYMYKVLLDWNEEYDTLTEADFKKAMNKLINVMNLTMPKYIPLLYEYEHNYQNALKKLESETESLSRFNDTPQNEQDEVDYNTPEYASNMGKSMSVAKVDSGSVTAKLKEMQDNFKSVLLSWTNEFDAIFIDEYQLEDF